MSIPDFLVCTECESPCYTFEWHDGKPTEILCEICGNDDPDAFTTPEDYEALVEG